MRHKVTALNARSHALQAALDLAKQGGDLSVLNFVMAQIEKTKKEDLSVPPPTVRPGHYPEGDSISAVLFNTVRWRRQQRGLLS